jgi:general secretion pathway protein G
MTLVELMITMVVIALLASIALPAYTAYINRARVSRAVSEMKLIEMSLERFLTDRGKLPTALSELGPTPVDPWGNPYQYLNMAGASVGKVRKDHALHPLNTDYDLYSKGADGKTATPLTASISRDDVVRARNGSYIGLASDY